jgi:hypothetical protein
MKEHILGLSLSHIIIGGQSDREIRKHGLSQMPDPFKTHRTQLCTGSGQPEMGVRQPTLKIFLIENTKIGFHPINGNYHRSYLI